MNKRKRKKRAKRVLIIKLRAGLYELILKSLNGEATEMDLDELFGLGEFDDTKDKGQT